MPRTFVFSTGLICAIASTPVMAVPATTAAVSPWQAGLEFDFGTAVEGFARRHAARPDDARTSIGYACALLMKQPRVENNIRMARDLLASVADASAKVSKNNDKDEAVTAAYLLARVEQDHLTPARLDSARGRYESLVRDHPGHALAGQAAVQLALLESAGASSATVDGKVARIDALLSKVRQPEAAGELHAILGKLHWRLRQDADAAIRHFVAGRKIGYKKPFRNAEIDLTIANLAREQGHKDLALAHYRAFLAANKRDVRVSTVRSYVAQLEAAP